MAFFLLLIGVITAFIAVYIYKIKKKYIDQLSLPDIQRDKYWGPGSAPEDVDPSIRPFKIEFTTEMITELKLCLANTRCTEPLEKIGFTYGFNNEGLNPLLDYWKNEYDFSAREIFFNKFPQYKTNIQGLDIHYLHIKPSSDDKIRTVPLLMLHGWPGSIRDFYEVINMLITFDHRYDFNFEIIVPSLPGLSFSQAPSKPGLDAAGIAVVMSNLMLRLGHQKYYIQGGDWGSIVGSNLSTLFPDEVLGFHTHIPVTNISLSDLKIIVGRVCPSLLIQAIKPDTLGLNGSPGDFTAWLVEKFPSPNIDGGLLKRYTYDEMLDNVMMYWVNNAATTVAQICAESFNKSQMALRLDRIPTQVPTAIIRFPRDSFFMESQLKDKYPNIVLITDFHRSGYFAALQQPKLLVYNIKTAIIRFEEFHQKNYGVSL